MVSRNPKGQLTPDLLSALSVVRFSIGVARPDQVATHLGSSVELAQAQLRALEGFGLVEARLYRVTDRGRNVQVKPAEFPRTRDLTVPWKPNQNPKVRA